MNGKNPTITKLIDYEQFCGIQKDKPVIIHCKAGGRSAKAIGLLQQKYGFDNLYNLKGGIIAYVDQIDPALPRY